MYKRLFGEVCKIRPYFLPYSVAVIFILKLVTLESYKMLVISLSLVETREFNEKGLVAIKEEPAVRLSDLCFRSRFLAWSGTRENCLQRGKIHGFRVRHVW